MTSSRTSSASPTGPTAKTGTGHTTAILAIILVSYFMILLDNSAPDRAWAQAVPLTASVVLTQAGMAWLAQVQATSPTGQLSRCRWSSSARDRAWCSRR